MPKGFPGSSVCKEPACNAGNAREMGSIPRSGRSPGGGHSNPIQYSCLENPMDWGAWQATVHGITKRGTWMKQLSEAQPGAQTQMKWPSWEGWQAESTKGITNYTLESDWDGCWPWRNCWEIACQCQALCPSVRPWKALVLGNFWMTECRTHPSAELVTVTVWLLTSGLRGGEQSLGC